jgi:hypothetical protein
MIAQTTTTTTTFTTVPAAARDFMTSVYTLNHLPLDEDIRHCTTVRRDCNGETRKVIRFI